MRFGPYIAFVALWSLLIYAPIAHWVWGGGWIGKLGALDFAGGTVVHVNAAAAALVCALVVGSRKDYARQAILPQNVPFTLLGAGLLWLGWFGFNAGSALGANQTAALAFTNTMFAPVATLVVWTILDLTRTKKATAIGAATGIVVGLVAITPAAGFVSPMSAIAIGAIAAFPSYYALLYRAKTRLDDSLDVLAAHGAGGITGALLTGVFASKAWNPAGNEGLIAGNPRQLWIQVIAIVATLVYSLVGTFLIVKVIALAMRLRTDAREEGQGMDFSQHGEEAYSRGEGAVLLLDGRNEP
jgi:Amt family ammonium transporter